ncbi:H(+)/Cl(-) exchange transporter ClcA [Camelimonas abortus]|uniref:H(+)/Cl(-) exchange transporter ClcA n=1 Tax=Camelimonas abortus TaxID=1017184 RepID=A0ABV7LDE2_9HYPH
MQEDQPDTPARQALFVFVALVAGALTGVFGGVFHLIIDSLVRWPAQLAEQLDGWRLTAACSAITMVAAVFAVWITRRFAPEASGSGVPEIEGSIEGLREVRWRRVLPVKFVAGVAAIGSGLALGREGPTIHMGGSAALASADMFRVGGVDRRALLAAGGAAGLACAFNAPLSAVLFVIEETRRQFPYTFRTYMGVFAAAVTGTLVTRLISGVRPFMPIATVEAGLAALPLFAVLGALLGVLGVLFNLFIMALLDFAAEAQKRLPYVWPAFVGLATGALFALAPHTVTGGERVISEIVVVTPALGALLLLAAARFVTSVTSYSAGAPGGIFAPILTLATCVGLAFGTALDMIQPGLMASLNVNPVSFGVTAMAALFTAAVRAPAVGVVLVVELTGAYDLTLPMLAACLTASLVAQWLGGRPIYEQMLERTLRQAGITAPPENQPGAGLAADARNAGR